MEFFCDSAHSVLYSQHDNYVFMYIAMGTNQLDKYHGHF